MERRSLNDNGLRWRGTAGPKRAAIVSATVSALSLCLGGSAQADSEIVGWDMSSITSPTPTVDAQNVNSNLATPVTLSLGPNNVSVYGSYGIHPNTGGGGVLSSPGYLVYDDYNPSSPSVAQTSGSYFQFTLTPTAGKPLNVDSIDIPNWFNQNGEAVTLDVTSSLDGYVSTIGSATFTNSFTNPSEGSISLGTSLQGLTSPVTIQMDVVGNIAYDTFGFGGAGTSGESLQVYGAVGATTVALLWTGFDGSGGNGTWNTSLTNSWKAVSNGAPATYADGDPVTFDSTGTNTNITVASGGVNPAAVTFNGGTYNFTGGSIGGSTASVTLSSSAGTVTFADSNAYSAGTTVNGGILVAANNTALGTGPLSVSGGTVKFTTAAPSVSSLAGTGGTVTLSNTNLTVGGDNTSTSFAGTINQNGSTTGGLTKIGSGTFSLLGASTYAGSTNISAGTLLVLNTSGSATGSGNLLVQSGATLGGSGIIVPGNGKSVTIYGGAILAPHTNSLGSSTLTINGSLNLNSGSTLSYNLTPSGGDEVVANSVTFGGSSEALNISLPQGAVSGLFPILKAGSFSGTGSPVFTVSGPTSDTYTVLAPGAAGNTFTNAYTIAAVEQADIWTGASSSNWNTFEANWNSPGGSQYYADGDPVIFDDSASTYTVSIFPTVSPSSITFNNTVGHTYNLSEAYNYGAVIGGTGAIYVNGTGTVILDSPTYTKNSYTGGTYLNAGVLSINQDNELGAVPAANTVNLTFDGGTLQAYAPLNSANASELSGTRTIQLNPGGGTLDTNGTQIELNGNLIQGPGALSVIGGGTLTYDSGQYNSPAGNDFQNTYSGGTNITNATVEITDNNAGSIVSSGTIVSGVFGTGPVNFNNGSTLQSDQYNNVVLANPIHLSGTFTYVFNFSGGDEGHGLVFSTADANGNATATPSVTTIATAGATLNLNFVSPGAMTISQQIVGGRLTLNTTGAGTLSLSNPSNTFSGLTVISGLVIAGTEPTVGRLLTINGGAVIFADSQTAIEAAIKAGYNNGSWNGSTGINSAVAANDTLHLTAVGYYTPATNTTYQNVFLLSTDVLAKYTYYGDANLDGKVDGSDYSLIDNGYLNGLTGWQNGDFNYDGVVDGSDYTLIDNAFNSQGAQISSLVAEPSANPTAQIAVAASASSVPEPAALGLLALGAIGLLGRKGVGRHH